MKNQLLSILAIVLLLVSCNTEKTQNELFEETQSGSVLIYTKYYYELTLPNNEIVYFTGIDDDGDMLNEQLFHFVETNFEDGITELETNWAIKILNRKFFQNSMAINFTLRNEWINKCKGLPNIQEELWKYNDHCKDLKNR